ncbi:cAMP-dependent protein kinase catalytic subunit [Coemansia thaxteri]|uniref:cAMP-dependent protein kinase n=1 Tax=Coemansia thaxteri TaxID=2663907 RepID=A0A9W8BIB5_9FUNG|nr:cAMP-dependent protein kinase catalytic subunit [Coemansia thaxteri]KAJ2008701.1 cAMP-dependent protein kinase catalytic subunit [Coemansia thaxteri]KAJ2473896.1 cAMP-dependent protein kinase catalytic subunit [Coemansia sp. RSA 2322]KAJ2488071.1 cAMP-dependent protein kinase catalytic subunit [Coemansia sp. RSA 2320]
MAFINKILQKTKNKIGDRDSSSVTGSASPDKGLMFQLDSPTDGVPGLPMSPGIAQTYASPLSQPYSAACHTQQPHPPAYSATSVPAQKHVVPSNAPMLPTSTNVATRAASFSQGAYAAAKGVDVYNTHAQIMYTAQQQAYSQPIPIQQGLVQIAQHPHQLYDHPNLQSQSQQHQHQQQPLPPPPPPPPEVTSAPLLPPGVQATTDRTYEDTHVQLSDFEVFRTVGTGSFGRVRLVRHQATNKYYAMKVLKKSHVVRAKQVEHVNSERGILAECDCPFIVRMLGTYQDRVNLYFFMEYVVGGELFTYLRRYHRFPPPVAKFYAAEVLLALEYMHARNIIWRDTKPENILLDHRGHVKLTDMGFAKKVVDRTWTLCGTPDYLAPEVIQAKGYGRSVDWWALGILIFEMIAGYPPFYDEDHYRLYEKILAGRIQWPAQFDPVARDLVSRLLTADLSRRLGNLHRGSADIKEHRWFAEVDWDRLAAREIPAPLIPPQNVEGDTSNFDKYPETPETYGDMTSPDPYADLFLDF